MASSLVLPFASSFSSKSLSETSGFQEKITADGMNNLVLKQEALQIYYEHNFYIYNNVIVGTTINIQINSKVCIHSKFKLFYKYFLKWIYIILFIEN